MVKKEFTYRGKSLEELQTLSLAELSPLLPAFARRKIKRGFTPAEQAFIKRLGKKSTVKTHCRDMIILPFMVNRLIKVVKGKDYEDVRVTIEMVGHRLGEFALTRKRLRHGAMGLGATKGSANKEKK